MVCQKCNNTLEVNEQFCSQCGTATGGEMADTKKEINKQVNAHVKKELDEETSTASKVIKFVVIGSLVVAYLGYRVFVSMENGAADQHNKALEVYDSGDTESALQIQEQAVESMTTTQNKISGYQSLAYMYIELERVDEGREAFNRALELSREGTVDRNIIQGEIAYLDGKWKASEGYFSRALEIDPSSFQAHNSLLTVYLDFEDLHPELYDPQKSVYHGQQALEYVDPLLKNSIKQNLAIAHFYNGEPDKTIEFMSASDMNREPYTAFWTGMAYLQKEDEEKARQYFEIAETNGFDIPDEIY